MSTPTRKRPARAPTIHDVATLAGVSSMTASRVVSGSTPVRQALREKVNAAIKELNYRPNVAARAARSGSVRIGIVLTNPKSSILGEFLLGAYGESTRLGVQLLVEPAIEDPVKLDALRRLMRAGVDGIILPPPLGDSTAALALLRKSRISALAFATADSQASIPAVTIDDFKGAASMTQHLIDLGHKRIAFVQGGKLHSPAQRREAGFRATMEKNSLPVRAAWIAPGDFTFKSGFEAARKFLSLAPRPTAIFAANDDMAAGVIALAHGMNLKLPDELSVAGFDDTPIAATLWPSLTTIHQPISTMASTAVRTIAEIVRRARAGEAGAFIHHRMECMLVVRASTASPSAQSEKTRTTTIS
ncbi:MAG: LacI family DNA-binding transcriptional regulator [Steroidobacteraceae bacterium]